MKVKDKRKEKYENETDKGKASEKKGRQRESIEEKTEGNEKKV